MSDLQFEQDLVDGYAEQLLQEEEYEEFLNNEVDGYFETKGYLSEWELLDNQ